MISILIHSFFLGEAILNAGHLILCGISDKTKTLLKLFALCLQTSALASHPHEISASFSVVNNNINILKATCSCKAGLGGKCKHVAATLLFCTRLY